MTRSGDASIAAGRLSKANQFFNAAQDIGDLADDEAEVRDATVTLLVHAGIAAADAICCKALGEYALGNESHDEAVRLIAKVNPDGRELSNALRRLLSMKTKAGYAHRPVTADEHKRAERAAEQLVSAARTSH